MKQTCSCRRDAGADAPLNTRRQWLGLAALAAPERPRGHWIDAKSAVYVLDSKRHDSMGPTIASFAQKIDAQKFAGQWGGKVLRFAEVNPEMVDLSGGALHDGKM